MPVDNVTILVSLTAAFVLGAVFAKMVTKVLKLAIAATVLILLLTHLPPLEKICETAQTHLQSDITRPFCR